MIRMQKRQGLIIKVMLERVKKDVVVGFVEKISILQYEKILYFISFKNKSYFKVKCSTAFIISNPVKLLMFLLKVLLT